MFKVGNREAYIQDDNLDNKSFTFYFLGFYDRMISLSKVNDLRYYIIGNEDVMRSEVHMCDRFGL